MSTFPIFNSNQTFFCIVILSVQILKLYTRFWHNKTDKYRERVNATFQSYGGGINLPQYFSKEEKNNDLVDGTEDLSDPGKQWDNNQNSNTASLNKTKLEWKFVSKNVAHLSRRNLFRSDISMLSKGVKFVPSANKIDRAKLNTELEEYGGKRRLMW